MNEPARTGRQGIVSLVGAGPGDPELLTLKAARLLREAEVVVYDRLVGPGILDLAAPTAELIYVGKERARHFMRQTEINALLVRRGQLGQRVVRLKGGDPLIFGRGGEEALHLARHGVACEIVPGVTAAAGCAASLGLPLTHRGLASGVRFVAGHCRADRPLDLDWAGLADPATTLVVYMGLAHIAEIACRLIEAGLAADTPAAAVANGTLPDQRSVVATLATLADRVQGESVEAPALFVVGRVVEVLAELAELAELRACGMSAPSGSAAAPGWAQNA
jgi:uroporphyrin-III C-methyltransferase/precorrin-2 dehydrogenase/sirohydrochlorin ferrochelatase/uroporphyrin-III C-methyltransferase